MNNYVYDLKDRSELKEFLPTSYQKVLEVGCDYGGFKNTLNGDIEIWGIEPNSFAAKEAEKRI